MSASTGDKITDVRNAARPVTTTVSSGRSVGGTSLACSSLTGWPTASKVHFVTYQIDSNSNPVAGTQLDCQGIVSGNTINSFSVIDGTDTSNSVGDVVEMLPTAAWGQDLADALTSTHNRSGGLKSGLTITSPTITTPTLTVPVITDFTSANHTHATTAQGGAISNVLMSVPYKFSVYRNTAGNFNNGHNIIAFDTKTFDTGSNVDIVTHVGRFTVPVAGFYQFNAAVGFTPSGTNVYGANIYKNGSVALVGNQFIVTSGSASAITVSGILQLAANDYIEIDFLNGAGTIAATTGAVNTYFQGCLVSAT